ncbi:MAG: hypothetical protein GEU28_02135 [Dehalococcoidia bacterium]|nr:hypothetical protein [Dehalococcoidia bacterium]
MQRRSWLADLQDQPSAVTGTLLDAPRLQKVTRSLETILLVDDYVTRVEQGQELQGFVHPPLRERASGCGLA